MPSKTKNLLLIAILLLLIGPTLFGIGMIVGSGRTLSDLEKLNFQRLTLAANLISAIATFSAVAIALLIADKQIAEARRKDQQIYCNEAVRTLHYAMAVTEDLRGRVTSLKKRLCSVGSYPLSTLNVTMEGAMKRYEAFYDIALYQHLPGPIIDQITRMSGSFAGMSILVSTISSAHGNQLHKTIDMTVEQPTKIFDDLFKEIDDLFTSLEKQRKLIGENYPI